MEPIPFNKPFLTGNESKYITEALQRHQLAGGGHFTQLCQEWLEHTISCRKALLTHSCTAALEMAAILADIRPGDEVIMPSYTFVSTANAFVLRGATPVYVDIRSDTQNIDESLIESAITAKTKAILVVHYAGVACEMNKITSIAKKYNLILIEDAAQALLTEYLGTPIGRFGDISCFSFHETKNIISGEGGALVINNPIFVERAEIIREKGTNRTQFLRGEVDKYTWVDIGSSYLPGELIAAFLWAQLLQAKQITYMRKLIWDRYYSGLQPLSLIHNFFVPFASNLSCHNGHIFYLKLSNLEQRSRFISFMSQHSIHSVFHYIPLHSSTFGRTISQTGHELSETDICANTLVRLPLWIGMNSEVDYIVETIYQFFESSP